MKEKLLKGALALFVGGLLSVSLSTCGPTNEPTPNSEQISLTLPATVDVVKGQDCVLPQGKGPVKMGDVIYLERSGLYTLCQVTNASESTFSFKLPSDFQEGNYVLYVKRGESRVKIGTITITLISAPIVVAPGTTVYGVVESAEGPVANVVVSDGVICTKTDANGIYQLKSEKMMGYVFISVPSGYDPEVAGAFPVNFKQVQKVNDLPQNVSFKLTKCNQDNYKVLFMGDMHLANRSANNDLGQFNGVASDINSYVNAHKNEKIYGITLGDMTWDLYWYTQKYSHPEYKKTINEKIKDLPIYHTIGNHDNDMRQIGNFNAKISFGTNIAPAWYSFNLGGVHYVMLDNIDCSAYTGNEERNQTEGVIYSPQLTWLAQDLSYVSKDTPVIVCMHAPVFSTDGPNKFSLAMRDGNQLIAALDGYKVHFVTGHTHRSFYIMPSDAVTGGKDIAESNVSALCSDWWWSGKLTPGYLQATDGTPSGYSIWSVSGKNMSWQYKCCGKDENFQFRAYDLNQVKFSMADVPLLTNASMKTKFGQIIADYTGAQKNEVLINVWGWNSKWSVTVQTTDGKVLSPTVVSAYDPIQIAANAIPRMNDANCTSEPIGTPQRRHHFVKVTAPDADSDLIITFTDNFGRKYSETMERPKAFRNGSINASYKININ